MTNVTFSTPDTIAPPAAAYSHAVTVKLGESELIFVAGQWSTDRDGNLVGENDMQAQTHQTMLNIQKVLEANGASFKDVFKLNFYVTDIDRRHEVGAGRASFLPDPPPISTLLEVTKLALPGLMVEVEAVAAKPVNR